MTVINNNFKPAFKATLSSDMGEDSRWSNIQKLYDKKTKNIKNYELMVYKTDNDTFMLSNYNEKTGLQSFNELSNDGMKKLLKNSDGVIADKLASFTRTMFNMENKIEQFKKDFMKLMNDAKIGEYAKDSMYSTFYDNIGSSQLKIVEEKLNKDDVFKNNIKLDV